MIYSNAQLLAAVEHSKRCQAALDAGGLPPWPWTVDAPYLQQPDGTYQRAAMCPRCHRRAVVACQEPGSDETLIVGMVRE